MRHTKLFNSNKRGKRACRHPCFNNCDFHNAVIHLPVAAEGNIQYKDNIMKICPDVSLTEDGNGVISPYEAMLRFIETKRTIPNLTVAAISGPGEALADFDMVKETFRLIRQINPEILLCLSTNGLMLPIYANHLISLGVNYVTVTVNTINSETGTRIYDHITYLGHKYFGVEGTNILLQNQISGISYLVSRGISVRMNIPVMEGINDCEISDIVRLAKECGCELTNIIKAAPGKRNDENGLETYSSDELSDLRRECETIMLQSYYCKPCYASTVETLNTRVSMDFEKAAGNKGREEEKPAVYFRFAVCSKNRTLTDQHFGHATKFHIYDYKDGIITFMEDRPIEQYCHGTSEEKKTGRIYQLIKAIEDCNCVICMRIGVCPSNALKEKNIDIYTTYNLIEDGIREAVNRLYSGVSFRDQQ